MTKSIWPQGDKTDVLIQSARGGDPDAVNQLLDRHRAAIHRLVEMRLDRRVQQRVDVSDVVQDVLVDASGRLDQYLSDPGMAFHLWLRQIAWDRIIDTYRRHRVSAKRSMDREQPINRGAIDESTMNLAIQLSDPGLGPAAVATQHEIARHVETAIETLEDADREVILMRHYEHLSNLEISEVLGLQPAAASMRYLRALRRLRSVLEQEDETG
ncbi:sigma-70 family RNA polymerase sigma factor [Allorhodopirellula solitaria]|uniref:RNA polymerase sigma factor CnrH n=1 Tax=Allorhodopirellula solitaria TaxID=2527987 RepID=A0A5C5YED0_9BACT|nr:sigma-70 family RNA polymerase sigma factor [Allorhodopirellula solitaria]TWT74107.1 RNA polymerase sigma factor CnrH [Allorhodopirellula solitaria]